MKELKDTITAQATVSGEGGIAIIRISGPSSEDILKKIFEPVKKEYFTGRRLTYGHIVWEQEIIDEVMAVYMPGKHTYTAESMAEIHCHGSQYIVSRILSVILSCGARLAEPGEFTYRAFVNGRIDLSQAEAVMRLIHASNERARRSAIRQMDGSITDAIQKLQSDILDIAAGISAYIDFPDEIEESETAEMILQKCKILISKLEAECNVRKGHIEDDGVMVALCGKPNAGKSSLLNCLVGQERAIVTEIPGTTRDAISDSVLINGIRFTFTDTAGLRQTDDVVERIGVERSQKVIENADIRILLIDSSEPLDQTMKDLLLTVKPDLVLLSKEDISRKDFVTEIKNQIKDIPVILISVTERSGISELTTWLCKYVEHDLSQEFVFSQTRHVELARTAAGHLKDAVTAVEHELSLDLVNVDLMAAIESLGEITGERATDSVIDRVFSQFCVGK